MAETEAPASSESGRQQLLPRAYGRARLPSTLLVTPLRPDARELLSNPLALPRDVVPPASPELAPRNPGAMRSLHGELAAVPDFRRAQGRKHTVACVLAMHVLAELANMKGCLAAAQFARSLAADDKRIRGANRNGEDHHETVALVDHVTGAPFALLNFGDEGGELATMHDLLERSDICGKVITLDALHTTHKTATQITERADSVFTVKSNAPETFGILERIDWERDAAGSFEEDVEKAHGRLEQRSIRVMTPLKGTINDPGVSQIARVTRDREPPKKHAGGSTALPERLRILTTNHPASGNRPALARGRLRSRKTQPGNHDPCPVHRLPVKITDSVGKSCCE